MAFLLHEYNPLMHLNKNTKTLKNKAKFYASKLVKLH